ncbi:hypothetical protein ASD15_15570 [Massilia sp. Root351]|jgi:hypothetical protein|uniref:hypothetical protein n=1 Tax=Massilia sp. Root351 TaxID=1736522 RepID=UPI000709280E|nr:hypothetical protein [Massilia sp. Root351]KQV80277.1 hypothetical protein ASD15_15570 [Massilia sp. Root351]
MRHLAIACAVLLLSACSTSTVQDYPAAWPPLSGMSADCREVAGAYIDLNARPWEPVDAAGKQPNLYAAWATLGFIEQGNAPGRKRSFALAFIDADTLLISYLMDNQPVASRRLARNKWRCDAGGLHVTTMERSGALVDKVPNHGELQRTATLYRVGNTLYVRRATDARIMMLHVLPEQRFRSQWERFQAD